MVYTVYTTENFEREMKKLSGENNERIRKLFLQIKDNPYVGDQLRYKFLREKRIYYLVYDELLAVLIVAISGKKEQKETIDHIVQYLEQYKEYLKERIMED